ncbi:MAG: transcriptional repressor [Clostridia bacterium]|nr:transcriptional repressor [Clostridia bacterium]
MENVQRYEEILRIFEDKDIRMTSTRKAVVDVFINHGGHMNAEEVYRRTESEKIGLATVYRTIEILKANGIIKELFVNGERLFELGARDNSRFHIHFSCNRCGRLEEYNGALLLNHLVNLKRIVERDWENEVEDMRIVLQGTCKTCLEER